MIGQMLGIARLEWLRLRRSPMALSLLLVVPMVQVILFGYAVRPGDARVTIAIAAPSQSALDQLANRLSRDHKMQIVDRLIAPRRAADAVIAGRALVGIDLPLSRSADNPDAPTLPVAITLDGSNAPLAAIAEQRIRAAYWQQRAERDRFADQRAGMIIQRIANPDLRDSWTFLPSLSGVVVMIATLLLGCLGVAREREGGTWETLQTLPVNIAALLLGKLLPPTVIGTVQGAAVILIAHLLFLLPVPPVTAILLLVMLPLFAAAHVALGLVISLRARTQLAALQGAVAFYLPAMLLSGFLYPVESMPDWARVIGSLFPLTHYVRTARMAMLHAAGVDKVIIACAPVALFLAVMLAISVAAQHRRAIGAL